MKYKLFFCFLFFFALTTGYSQPPTDKTKINVVDTLSKKQRGSRNVIISKAELDSINQAYMASLPPVKPQEPVVQTIKEIPTWIIIACIGALVVIAILLFSLFNYHKRLNKTVSDLKRLIQ